MVSEFEVLGSRKRRNISDIDHPLMNIYRINRT